MATGRKPSPISILDNKTRRLTKQEIEARKEAEPSGCSDELKPPKELKGEALKEWKRVVALYRELDTNILNDLDISLLSAYCESVAIYRKAQVEYKKRALLLKTAERLKKIRF